MIFLYIELNGKVMYFDTKEPMNTQNHVKYSNNGSNGLLRKKEEASIFKTLVWY